MPWVTNQRGNANGAQAWEAALPNEGWKFKSMNKFDEVLALEISYLLRVIIMNCSG